MKKVSTFLLAVLVVVFYLSSSSFAGDKTMVDGVLQIPKTTVAPEIDGEMDPIWKLVTANPLLKFEAGGIDTNMSFDDHFSTYRVMWDDENFYFFAKVVDDTVLVESTANPWENDCIEIFYDGGNDKAFQAMDSNDIQTRYVFGETPASSPQGDGRGNFAFVRTDYGYNFELAIPQDSLIKDVDGTIYSLFDLVADHEIGFEVSNADRDNNAQGRAHVTHWWTSDGNTWQYSHLYGSAILSGTEIDEVAHINYAENTPTIDGVMEEGEGWEGAVELTLELMEGDPEPRADTVLLGWDDHRASVWTLWDEENFYLFANVVDDTVLVESTANPWENDCIEIFYDGGNDKAFQAMDSNDIQTRYVFGESAVSSPQGDGRGEFVFVRTDYGYTFEVKVPQDSLIKDVDGTIYSLFDLEADHEIGLEISNADRDNNAEGRSHVLHWWTNDGNTWQYSHLYGSAVLVPSVTSVKQTSTKHATTYKLNQNYPNPFNPTTKISFSVPEAGLVTIKVFNILGQEVATLLNEELRSGTFEVDFNGNNLNSGVYFYKMETSNISITKKMMLLK